MERLDWSYAQEDETKGSVKEIGDGLDVELLIAADVVSNLSLQVLPSLSHYYR